MGGDYEVVIAQLSHSTVWCVREKLQFLRIMLREFRKKPFALGHYTTIVCLSVGDDDGWRMQQLCLDRRLLVQSFVVLFQFASATVVWFSKLCTYVALSAHPRPRRLAGQTHPIIKRWTKSTYSRQNRKSSNFLDQTFYSSFQQPPTNPY